MCEIADRIDPRVTPMPTELSRDENAGIAFAGYATAKIADLIAAADLLRSSEWRKIEEAKRDGTHYWLYFPTAHPDNRQCVGWYVSRSDWEGFIDAADSEHDQPTHFQPLPQPPEGETR